MKNKIYFLLSLPFCLFMAACEHEIGRDGEDSVGDLSSIRISVSDAGFAPAAQEDGEAVYSRDFKVGDKIGVFAVMNGVMVEGQSNMCFTASDNGNGGIVWTTEDLDEGAFFSEAVYFAYYPYMEGLSATLDPESADAGQFFSEMISSFIPEKEQSGISAFDASDLMIGSGLISNGNTVAFVMEHAMSMVVIELPTEYYSFDNTDYEIPDYVIGGFKDAVFDGFTPYSEEGHVFKYIVNSGVSVSVAGSYVDDGGQTCSWDEEVMPGQGKYSKVLVDGGVNPISHTLSPGDFFLADGRLLSKDASAGEVAAADVIGVVFQINPERMDPAIADSLGGVVHALVIGTKSVKETPGDAGYYHWGMTGMDETLIGFTNIFGGYGLITKDGIGKPAFYALRFLQSLGKYFVARDENYFITKDDRGNYYMIVFNCCRMDMLFYQNQKEDISAEEVERLFEKDTLEIQIIFRNMKKGKYHIKKSCLGSGKGNILDNWKQLGYGKRLEKDEVRYLSSVCIPKLEYEELEAKKDSLAVNASLCANEIQLYKIRYMGNTV